MNASVTSPGQPVGNKLLLFLDSAVTEAWEKWLPLGFFHGVTTNPLLLERAGEACTVANLHKLARKAKGLGAGEIQLQTWGDSAADLVRTGHDLASLQESGLEIVIKIPASTEGFLAARELRQAGLRITMTAVYTPGQVMLTAGLGANYAAPYVGRLIDDGQDGIGTVTAMQKILRSTDSSTRLLTASLRSGEMVTDLAVRGLDTFTFGPAVAEELFVSDLTNQATADFQRAAQQG